jgi:hypothetical protein
MTVSDQLTDDQAQQLLDAIIAQCENMDLDAQQILDGLGRSIMSAADAFGKTDVTVSIENFGQCRVKLASPKQED